MYLVISVYTLSCFVVFVSRVKKLIEGSGKVVIGGQVEEGEKYVSPTVLTDCKATDPVMMEEVGPGSK